jgi:hypothetical protein
MKYVFTAIGGYLVGWFITYAMIMRGDFQYFFEYWKLAWTKPGELPTFINLGAIATACIAPLGLWGYLRFRSK